MVASQPRASDAPRQGSFITWQVSCGEARICRREAAAVGSSTSRCSWGHRRHFIFINSTTHVYPRPSSAAFARLDLASYFSSSTALFSNCFEATPYQIRPSRDAPYRRLQGSTTTVHRIRTGRSPPGPTARHHGASRASRQKCRQDEFLAHRAYVAPLTHPSGCCAARPSPRRPFC